MDNGASSYRRYLNGDEDAFGEIVKEYFDSLVFFIDRFVNDHAVAEDIALDAFTQLVVNKKRYNFSVSLKTFLFMIGRSRALDYLKHKKKLQMVDLDQVQELSDEEASLEDLVLADERKRKVNAAIAKLPEEMQAVIHLVYFEQLSAEDAGKVLRKNRKQVYNLLYRAKAELRKLLGEDGDGLL